MQLTLAKYLGEVAPLVVHQLQLLLPLPPLLQYTLHLGPSHQHKIHGVGDQKVVAAAVVGSGH